MNIWAHDPIEVDKSNAPLHLSANQIKENKVLPPKLFNFCNNKFIIPS